jgi:signal transduction histidine kinase
MNSPTSRAIRWLKNLLATSQPEPASQAERIVRMQLHIVIPAKVGVIAVALYYVLFSSWFRDQSTPRIVALQFLNGFFIAYLIANVFGFFVFLMWRRFQPGVFQWIVFTLGMLDGLFVSGLVFITGGFDSIAFWIFPGLIVLNALSIPLTAPQLVLNLLLSVFYFTAGFVHASFPSGLLEDIPTAAIRPSGATNLVHSTNRPISIPDLLHSQSNSRPLLNPRSNMANRVPYSTAADEPSTQPVLMSMVLLWLLAVCCYGVQVLAERQRRVAEEERESAVRQAQLHSAGRLSAEFAHQIKNPLAIINNAAFSIHRALKSGRTDVTRQIEIIQEEVERSDRIITRIMGYAQLNEGRVEKLDVAEELDKAVDEVFPSGAELGIKVERNYVRTFPPLLMQRRHLGDVLVNLLQNAREALNGKGEISVSAVCRPDHSVEISVRDDGSGIPPDKVERIFEAYYSTKEKGSGLGLSIVKHNVELYAGTVKVESELGKGSRFILTFPAKTVISSVK